MDMDMVMDMDVTLAKGHATCVHAHTLCASMCSMGAAHLLRRRADLDRCPRVPVDSVVRVGWTTPARLRDVAHDELVGSHDQRCVARAGVGPVRPVATQRRQPNLRPSQV